MSIKKALKYIYICDDCGKDGEDRMFSVPRDALAVNGMQGCETDLGHRGQQGCEEDDKHLCSDCLSIRLIASF